MRHFDFPDDVLEEIQRDRFKHPTRLVQERMEILWLNRTAPEHAATQAAFLKERVGAAFGRGASRSAIGLLC